MRFLMMVKHAEKFATSAQELMDAMAILTEEAIKAGHHTWKWGLAPTAQSTRVPAFGGQIKVTDGPFTEAKEIIGGYAEFELKSKEEPSKERCASWNSTRKHWPDGGENRNSARIFGPETSRNPAGNSPSLVQKQAS